MRGRCRIRHARRGRLELRPKANCGEWGRAQEKLRKKELGFACAGHAVEPLLHRVPVPPPVKLRAQRAEEGLQRRGTADEREQPRVRGDLGGMLALGELADSRLQELAVGIRSEQVVQQRAPSPLSAHRLQPLGLLLERVELLSIKVLVG